MTGPPSSNRTIAAIATSSGDSTISTDAATILSNKLLSACLAPVRSGWSTYSNGSPATARTLVRGPATSSKVGARHSSVWVFSSSHASRRSGIPFNSGQASTATVSALNRHTDSATSERPPTTGTSAIIGDLNAVSSARQAATTHRP